MSNTQNKNCFQGISDSNPENKPEFTGPLNVDNIEVLTALETNPTTGNLVYEYHPFRNYRVQQTMYRYNNKLLSPKELFTEIGYKDDSLKTDEDCINKIKELEQIKEENISVWEKLGVPKSQTNPILIEAGELTDFETNELSFDLKHPVDILPQYSYDNSVNLIINDGKNIPRLINSRFSAIGRNQYQIVDRKGSNDSNIYDGGSQFDIDTSLYKRVTEIPRLSFLGLTNGGKMPIGNYHFYFKYSDADGNETDFVAESGLVSIFIGNDPGSIRSGFRNENSHKSVNFHLTNIDSAYQYVTVYYTRSTSDINENSVVTANKINQKFIVNNFQKSRIIITGYEDVEEITTSEINPSYQIVDSVNTQTSCQNMLFLGNVKKPNIPYQELQDISLRFLPFLNNTSYDLEIDKQYNISSLINGYYDPNYIYDKVGYWNHELYRFGIVYILSDNSLTPVFNIRGAEEITSDTIYSEIPFKLKDGHRNYIITEENTYKIISDPSSYTDTESDKFKPSDKQLENSMGVISLGNLNTGYKSQQIFGIQIKTSKEVLEYLQDTLKIKGFFFVRQKRIPTILCQAYTIGIDPESKTPILPIDENTYIAERFIDDEQKLSNNFEKRQYKFKKGNKVRVEGAICPEYDVDSAYLNSLFTGDKFTIQESDVQPQNQYLTLSSDRNLTLTGTKSGVPSNIYDVKIIGVEDNTKLVAINDKMFSARAGDAEEAFRYEYLEEEIKKTSSSNLIRGSFGPYLGITGYNNVGKLIDIKIPGFIDISDSDLFKIRYNDKSSFYSISDRIDLKSYKDWFEKDGPNSLNYKLITPLYRGDCYICQFTHRMNRNFQDPSAPINDKIVDENCWAKNYEISDGVLKIENFDKINLGDVNAVKLGMWVTLTVRSTKNLNIRSINDSIPDEIALTGHNRGFYPYYPMSPEGSYKIPEALCYNKGFEKSLSERYNFESPDVPAIKNEFTNRISYSDIHVNDAFKNGFRVFQGTHFRDYPKTYGSITKILELRGNILCVFEHGIALIPVNERVEAGKGSGGNVYINTSNVLPENPKIISDTFGSQWKDSIIQTPAAIYGVDTIGKKIWRTNGEMFECISDFKVQEFLNNNISLTERELNPIIGIRNVKTHYNKFKHDVMFTFYDNLHGFEEKTWNLCYNELLQKWVTFYSWIPSYSENIYNQYFSFDRNTSKWITKLGVSHTGNDFADGITLSNNIIPNDGGYGYEIGELTLSNRELPQGKGISYKIKYSLQRDNFGNWKKFEIKEKDGKSYLCLKTDISYLYNRSKNSTSKDKYTQPENLLSNIWRSNIPTTNVSEYPYVWRRRVENNLDQSTYEQTDEVLERIVGCNPVDLCSELFERYNFSDSNEKIDDLSENSSQIDKWKTDSVLGSKYKIAKDENGRRKLLSHSDTKDCRRNPNTIVYLLNIKAEIEISYENSKDISLSEVYVSGFKNGMKVDGGYYESVVAVIPEYNKQFLTTDFWRHGQAGIIDISDEIQSCKWYDKQHPFEFEFIVADNPQAHKIFDNLAIISNNAEPESFHYEIIGDCFNFAKDKKNMYIRQEATKELYQYNGSDITFDSDYSKLESKHRKNYTISNGKKQELNSFDRSTLLPLYYQRQDTINEIEDSYHLKNDGENKDFSALAGGEIVHYKTLDEYRIWNHVKAVDITDPEKGRLRGNMHYKEDEWYVQINPLNIVEKNEQEWRDLDGKTTNKIPVELNQNPIPSEVLKNNELEVPQTDSFKNRGYTTWDWNESQNQEVKMKDKWIKIRIRYTGNNISIISAVRTMYSLSYS